MLAAVSQPVLRLTPEWKRRRLRTRNFDTARRIQHCEVLRSVRVCHGRTGGRLRDAAAASLCGNLGMTQSRHEAGVVER
eukprot:3725747-Rhodomonas_salina.2